MLDIRHEYERVRPVRAALVMGVLNTTPDSFSDGGLYLAPEAARTRVDELIAAGADIIDIGAESTKPGSPKVSAEEQLARMDAALRYALTRGAWVSVDTSDADVAKVALERGAHIINDVSGLCDPRVAEITSAFDAWLVVTHCRVQMDRMAGFSQWPDDDYADIVEEVKVDWGRSRDRAMKAGMKADKLVFDPGLGYSKNARHSFEVLGRLREFLELGAPILSGPGRKSFIAAVDGSAPGERLGGTIAASLLSADAGAHMIRVHDVREVRQALAVWARGRHAVSG
ncbi:MAG TPA: dihydropteroate synthase [Polyangiaceae bacterium]|jgi:dihydropteroate synthase|nr:dihydropteroate synthase [Polyangiaceae bacterium]